MSHRYSNLIVLAILFLSLLGMAECPQEEGCPFNEPATFRSLEELECGIAPDGLVYCHWQLSFDGVAFQWYHSDVAESGTYECQDDSVTGSTGYTEYSGDWDAATGILTWEGVAYQQQ